jgi:hypothetical protein
MRYLEECEAAQGNRKKQKQTDKGKGTSGVAAPLFGEMPFVASASVKKDVQACRGARNRVPVLSDVQRSRNVDFALGRSSVPRDRCWNPEVTA